MMYVGIDPSPNKTAIVFLADHDDGYQYDFFRPEFFRPEDDDGEEASEQPSLIQRTKRLLEIASWIGNLATRLQIPTDAKIAIEAPAHSQNFRESSLQIAAVRMTIACTLVQRGYTFLVETPVTQARAQVLGKGWGRAKKTEVRKELLFRGKRFKNMDVMDAWMMAAYLKGVQIPEPADADPRRRWAS